MTSDALDADLAYLCERRYLVSIDGDATNIKLARLICIENGVDPFSVYEVRGEVCVDPFSVYTEGGRLQSHIPTGDVPSAIMRLDRMTADQYAAFSAGPNDVPGVPAGSALGLVAVRAGV